MIGIGGDPGRLARVDRPCCDTTRRRAVRSGWLKSYDLRRLHTALDGSRPIIVLVSKVGGKYSQPLRSNRANSANFSQGAFA